MRLSLALAPLVALATTAWLAATHLRPEAVASAAEPVPVRPSDATPAPGTVQQLRFSGAGIRGSALASVGDLAAHVTTRVGAPLDVAALEADRRRLAAVLVDAGFLDAAIAPPTVQTLPDGTAWVELPVRTGTRYVFRGVRVEGRALARHPELADVPTVAAGQPVSAGRVEASARLLTDWLRHRAVRARVTHRVTIDRATKQVDVTYRVAVARR